MAYDTFPSLWGEVEESSQVQLPTAERYARLSDLLDRTSFALIGDEAAQVPALTSRLHLLCRHYGCKPQPAMLFTRHAREAGCQESICSDADFLNDLKGLCDTLACFTATPIPASLQARMPAQWQGRPQESTPTFVKRIRLIVTGWDKQRVWGYNEEQACDAPLIADLSSLPPFAGSTSLLWEGAQVNLLSCRITDDGTVVPSLMVLEPDYLIDITSLTECIRPYGNSPWEYILGRLHPMENSHYRLLGNAANQFLDDCVNSSESNVKEAFKQSLMKFFAAYPLELSTCDKVDTDFFHNCQEHFNHIHSTLSRLLPAGERDVTLEPSFLCESLGLQGRMDFLTGDHSLLIELKSGKYDEFNHCSNLSHALQVTFYKEILFYNLDIPRKEVESYLFYSRYPRLFKEEPSQEMIATAIDLRNHIVSLDLALMGGEMPLLLANLTPGALCGGDESHPLWRKAIGPKWEAFLKPLHQNDATVLAYFHAFWAFTAREQYLDKMGSGHDSHRGFADVWRGERREKIATGNMIEGLSITRTAGNEGIDEIEFSRPMCESMAPNFRNGDLVLIYPCNTPEDSAVNKQILRGTLVRVWNGGLLVSLRYAQKNSRILSPHSRYAIEHDRLDSSSRALYRGLYSLLTAPADRQELLLARRRPTRDTTPTLVTRSGNAEIDSIVLQAKQAQDYFLLVGPPGTGKTSIALSGMVREFHSDPACNILLLAYTHRAVDEICGALEMLDKELPYIRIGSHLSCDPRYQSHLLSKLTKGCTTRAQLRDMIASHSIFVGTVLSVAGKTELFTLKHFDVAIIDEASQILEPQIVGLLSSTGPEGRAAIGKFVMIGDFKQLPAVVQQSEAGSRCNDPLLRAIGVNDLRSSLFERLYTQVKSWNIKGITATLHKQGRMHILTARFAALHFYGGLLNSAGCEKQEEPLTFHNYDASSPLEKTLATRRTAFFPTDSPPVADPVKTNRSEAQLAARIVKIYYDLFCKNGQETHWSEKIGIIAPFRNQIAMIYSEMEKLQIPSCEKITVDTVERYQGSQRDIILYCTTVSHSYQMALLSSPILIDGTPVDRKLNVAVTRARKQLFVTGIPAILSQSPLYKALMEEMNEENSALE